MFSDTLIPYKLASMHPLLHMALLATSGLLQLSGSEDFFFVPQAASCEDAKALKFIDTGKYELVALLQISHFAALFLHWFSGLLADWDSKVAS